MAKNIKKIANDLGAEIVAKLPDASGGAFGASRLSRIIERLQTRLVPGKGRRSGRPSDSSWVHHPKVPMSEATEQRLTGLAELASATGRKVSPMQLAAQILADALSTFPEINAR